jgi:predicted dehydrogenase
MIKIGLIGHGHWGPNYIKAFSGNTEAEITAVFDIKPVNIIYPNIKQAVSAEAIFTDKNIDAVIIATPTSTHFELVRDALIAGKHVLVEKPITDNLKEAAKLLGLAQESNLTLMVGHIFVYNKGIQYIKRGIERNEFGKLQYLSAVRVNPGPVRNDINVISDLAVHEISIFDYIFGQLPNWVTVSASCPLGNPREDVAFISLSYDNVLANIYVSWIDLQKVRTLTIVGATHKVFWNDLDTVEPVRIYQKEPLYRILIDLKKEEPLKTEVNAFISKIVDKIPNLSEGYPIYRVMQVHDAIQTSLKEDGRKVYL